MEAIGRLAGGVAHDFNNALGTMIGYVSFLLEDLPAGSRDHLHAQRLMKAADHAKEIVRQILAYSRGEQTERRVGDLRAMLADVGSLIRASLPASTGIALELMPDAAPVLMNESEIHQILLNLCINANDSLEDRTGHITISLERSDPPATGGAHDPAAAHVTGGRVAADRSYVRLRVVDDGSGMDQETLSRIFEPFFTTKERGRGTGLGLAVVHGIIATHDGAYVVDSRPGEGTRFSIYLPLDPSGPAPVAVRAPELATRGHESVLVIDDDGDLLDVMAIGLERLGYAVVGTENPADALESLAADPGLWDVVVTDQVMPGMKGLELLAAVKRIRADCPVILCTGFSSDMTEARARARGADGFFFKPVEPAAIARRIRELLDR
jgi:CheY-like chemotaxis protein